MTNKSESHSRDQAPSYSQTGAFGRFTDIGVWLDHSPAISEWSKKPSYKPIYTRRVLIGAKQRLTNQCRRRRSGQLSFAAHDRYRLRSTRRGITVSRADATDTIPQQRRVLATRSSLSTGTSGISWVRRLTRPSAPNLRAMIMADTKVIEPIHVRSDEAQPSHQNRSHITAQSLSRIHVSEPPISRRSTLPSSARSFSQWYAVFREQSTRSATSVVPATPPSSRSASRKSSFDHEGVYRPVSSSRSGGTDWILMPASYAPEAEA